MKKLLMTISFFGLLLTVLPAFLTLSGKIDFEAHKTLMAVGAGLWFVTAPFWMRKERT